jgi:phenylalanyl-tRNA synthetase beta chain
MKIPYAMLLDLVNTSLSAQEAGDLLTMAGFELEGVEQVEGDWVLDIKVVSNRGDGLSALGLAREILAKDTQAEPTDLYLRATSRFPSNDDTTLPHGERRVTVETEACTRYACRLIEQVDPKAPTPQWIQERLRQAGMRPISLFVDLTNYVMLELGQPLHAFDHDRLHGRRIVVREARLGEKLSTLDGEERELQPGQMMICDADRPVAAAGIMGGLETEVTDETRNVLLESAHFVNTSVRRTRKQLGLSTEASYRFERSVDPEGVVAALNRFKELLQETDASQKMVIVPGVEDVYPRRPEQPTLQLRMSRATRLLGMHIETETARAYLHRLGFEVEGPGEPFVVLAPPWRPDVEREDDLVEEIGRVHGYEKIPEQLPQGSTPQGGVFGFEKFLDDVRDRVVRHGFVQIISHSLRSKHPLDYPGSEMFGPRNPNSPDMAYLRNSLLPGLSDSARRNGSKDLHLFEIGPTFGNFIPDAKYDHDAEELAILSTGSLLPTHWEKGDAPEANFFSLKAVVEDVLAINGANRGEACKCRPSKDSRLHPTRQAAFSATSDGVQVALLGQIHPDLAEELDLPAETVLAEIDLYALYAHPGNQPGYTPISRNPSVRRDISLQLSKSVPYERVQATVAQAAGEVLERQWLFDVYAGANMPEGEHSMAIALQLRKQGENFTDEEANQVREKVAEALVALGATLR